MWRLTRSTTWSGSSIAARVRLGPTTTCPLSASRIRLGVSTSSSSLAIGNRVAFFVQLCDGRKRGTQVDAHGVARFEFHELPIRSGWLAEMRGEAS